MVMRTRRNPGWSVPMSFAIVALLVLLQWLSTGAAGVPAGELDSGGAFSKAPGSTSRNAFSLEQSSARRLLQASNETGNVTTETTETRPLAVRNDRYDPTRAFRKYRGGYDIENRHYQASVLFTGVPAFVVAVVWLLAGLLLLCLHRKLLRGGRNKGAPKWRFYYWGPLLLAGIVTLLSVLVLVVIVVENSKFHKHMGRVETTISDTADRTAQAIFNVTSHVAALGQVNGSDLGLTLGSWQNATRLTAINDEAERLQVRVADFVHVLHKVFEAMKISLYAGSTAEVFLLLLGLGLALLLWRFRGMRRWLLWLTALCWILTTVVWIGAGLYIVANNVADDTCTAMSEFIQDPESTTLDSILPCGRLQRRAVSALQQIQQGLTEAVSEINGRLSQVGIATGRNIQPVCNPFAGLDNASVIYMTASCPANTTAVGDLPSVLQPLTCSKRAIDTLCWIQGRVVTQQQYNASVMLSAGLQSLITDYVPVIQNLAKCSFVLDAFSSILDNQCQQAQSALRRIWILLLLLASVGVLVIVCWLLAVKRNWRQPRWGSVIATDSP